MTPSPRRVGMAVVGLGGAVATTAVAGLELLRLGVVGPEGLPLAELDGQVARPRALRRPRRRRLGPRRLRPRQGRRGARRARPCASSTPRAPACRQIAPWAAAGDAEFCRNVVGGNTVLAEGRRAQADAIRADLRRFREQEALDGLVVVNLASHRALARRWTPPRCRRPRRSRPASTPTTTRSAPACSTPTPRSWRAAATRTSRRRSAADAPGAACARRAARRAGRRQGRQDRPDDDEDGPRARLPQPRAQGRGLVLHQHPRQPRRPRARRPELAGEQAQDQGPGARLDPGLPGRGPRRPHRLLPPARRPEGGLGRDRPGRLPRPADAGQGRLPVPRLDPRRAPRARARPPARRRAAARRGRRAGAARLVLQGADDAGRRGARARPAPPGAACCWTGSLGGAPAQDPYPAEQAAAAHDARA